MTNLDKVLDCAICVFHNPEMRGVGIRKTNPKAWKVIRESKFFTDSFGIIICWVLKLHCVIILNIFSIYLKTSKLVIISVLWKHNKKTTKKTQ